MKKKGREEDREPMKMKKMTVIAPLQDQDQQLNHWEDRLLVNIELFSIQPTPTITIPAVEGNQRFLNNLILSPSPLLYQLPQSLPRHYQRKAPYCPYLHYQLVSINQTLPWYDFAASLSLAAISLFTFYHQYLSCLLDWISLKLMVFCVLILGWCLSGSSRIEERFVVVH